MSQSYLSRTRDYLYARRKGFAVVTGIVGGVYLVAQYAVTKITQVQNRMQEQTRDRENLRRRFAQNQEDCTFTVLALLPTLGDQLFEAMDVEQLTARLQSQAHVKKQVKQKPESPQPQPEPVAPAVEDSGYLIQSKDYEGEGGATEAAVASVGEESRALTEVAPGLTNEAAQPMTEEATTADEVAETAANLPILGDSAATAAEVADTAAKLGDEAAQKAGSAAPLSEEAATASQVADTAASLPILSDAAATASQVNDTAATLQAQDQDKADEERAAVDELVKAVHDENIHNPEAPLNEGTVDGPAGEQEVGHGGETTLEPESVAVTAAEEQPPAAATHLAPESASKIGSESGSGSGIFEPAPEPIRLGASLTPSPGNATPAEPASDSAASPRAEPAPALEPAPAPPAPAPRDPTPEEILAEKRAKVALWNELKIVAFSRTLTVLYTLVLLTLQTHVQLNLVGRFAYVASVGEFGGADDDDAAVGARGAPSGEWDDEEEHEKHFIRLDDHEHADGDPSLSPATREAQLQHDDDARRARSGDAALSRDTERRYLTYSWWFLHRGWHDVAQRVQEAVKEVFGAVPLKSQITHAEFSALISRVRRRVEYEPRGPGGRRSGAEGDSEAESRAGASLAVPESHADDTDASSEGRTRRRGKRTSFLAALFPATRSESLSVLVQAASLTPGEAAAVLDTDTRLAALVDETLDTADSRDFAHVLRLCLDRVFDVFDATMRPVFGVGAPAPASAPPPPPPRFRELAPGEDERDVPHIVGKRVRLAALFPAVARQAQLAVHGNPNEYVECLADVKELRALSAVIYSSWGAAGGL